MLPMIWWGSVQFWWQNSSSNLTLDLNIVSALKLHYLLLNHDEIYIHCQWPEDDTNTSIYCWIRDIRSRSNLNTELSTISILFWPRLTICSTCCQWLLVNPIDFLWEYGRYWSMFWIVATSCMCPLRIPLWLSCQISNESDRHTRSMRFPISFQGYWTSQT